MLAIFGDAPHGIVFIERAAHLRRHANQIALPGGIAEAGDGDDLTTTALRELNEEVGIAPNRVRIVGRLPEVRQAASQFLVTPIVAILDPNVPLTIDRTESAGVFTIPLESVVEAGALREDSARSGELGRTIYALDYEGRQVWGLTARILKSFADRWNAPRSPLRAAIESLLKESL